LDVAGAAVKIAVMGAGSVGCYFGGMLARADHDVTLIARDAHVQAIRRDGLLLDTQNFREYVQVRAESDASEVKDAELVLFCVKSIDTDSAATSISQHLAEDAVVLSLQNGVDNVRRLESVLHQRVLPTVVYVATEMVAPGHVKHHGRGELVIAESAQGEQLAALFRLAGIPMHLSVNMIGAQWAKLIVNCAFNPLSAIAQLPFGLLLQGAGVEAVMRDVVAECLAVADAARIQVPGDSWEALGRTGRQSGQYASMAQDLARGKLTEIDHLNGYIVQLGQALGVSTPVNQSLQVLVKLLEHRSI
jgi:2-dehydropantoate 2-reductase